MNKINLEKLYQISKTLDVLYIEDDIVLQEKMKLILKDLFHTVDCCKNGVIGLEKYKKYYENHDKYYDIVITDILMPQMNGVELAKKIHQLNKKQNIIVVSAYDDSKYLIEFIDIGIEKFIKKPFESKSLISSLLNVLESKDTMKIYLNDTIVWDTITSKLYDSDKEVTISNSEIQLLKLFINNPHQVFSKYDLFNVLEEDNFDMIVSEDSIKSIIKRLRKKLPEDCIKNIYGRGYTLNL